MKRLLIIISIMLCVGCGSEITYKTITPESTFNEIAKTTIIDVRSEAEYKSGHIESSINIPLDNIEKIKYKKDEKIIVYCASGRRSKMAADKLISLGYKNVYDMGGISNWKYDLVGE